MAVFSLSKYIADAPKRDAEYYARQEALRRSQIWMNLDFLDQVWKLRQSTLGWCNALALDI